MKTPREILFERHRNAEPKLDEIRRGTLATLSTAQKTNTAEEKQRHAFIKSLIGKVWCELIWPSRRIWAGMAAAWLVILAVNMQMNASSNHSRILVNEVAAAVKEQRQLLTELVQHPVQEPALPTTPASLRPRSERERRSVIKFC